MPGPTLRALHVKQESIWKSREHPLPWIALSVARANTRPAWLLSREQRVKTAQREPFRFLWELRLKLHVANVPQASMQR